MPKKMGGKSKTEAPKAARRNAGEEQLWLEGEGEKSRAAKKREEESEKRAEAAAKKAEVRRLVELEQRDLEESVKRANKLSMSVSKVTKAELFKRKEVEQAALRRIAEDEKKKMTRVADEDEYERMVSEANMNRDDSVIIARTVEGALAHMTVADSLPVIGIPKKGAKGCSRRTR